eukprot:945475-Prymnesium_polylepis.1
MKCTQSSIHYQTSMHHTSIYLTFGPSVSQQIDKADTHTRDSRAKTFVKTRQKTATCIVRNGTGLGDPITLSDWR